MSRVLIFLNMKSDPLSKRERQIMDILFRRGEASAAEVHAELPSPPSYSATRAMLSTLMRKERIRHQERDGKYYYRPNQPRRQAAASAIRRVLDTFYAGSASAAIAGILETQRQNLTREEVDRLNKLIEEAACIEDRE